MPRESPYDIKLSREERQILDSSARRYTLPYFTVLRARIVLLAAGGSPTMKSALHFRRDETWSASGANASSTNDWPAWRSDHGPADPGVFPPEVVVQIKALACELSVTLGLPLFTPEHCRHRTRSTAQWHRRHHQQQQEVWRWLNEDAIRPWQHRCWIFPRDPNFAEKAGRIMDLYERTRKGRRLKADEFVICTDEKNSIQARIRKHPSSPPAPGRAGWVEHEYGRGGAWAYLAALDVHRAKLFGRCEKTQL